MDLRIYLSSEFRIGWIGQKNSLRVGEGLTVITVVHCWHGPLLVVRYRHVAKSVQLISNTHVHHGLP